MSMFARSGSRVRNRSRSRRNRNSRYSATSWKSGRSLNAGLNSTSSYDNKEIRRSASTRSRTSYPGKRSASFHDEHIDWSRSALTRKSFGGHSSDTFKGCEAFRCPDPGARNSYCGAPVVTYKDSNHLTLGPRNSYSENSSSSSHNEEKDFRRSHSQRSARTSKYHAAIEAETSRTDINDLRRCSSRKSSCSYAGITHLNKEHQHISRTSSQKSARSFSGYSEALRQFQRSCSERSNRTRERNSRCSYNNTIYKQRSPYKRKCPLLNEYGSNGILDDGVIWDRTLSQRSRYSLPGERTGFYKPSPSWIRESRNKSVGSIELYGSILCVDLENSVFDDTGDDIKETEKRCESYLSPECKCHDTELETFFYTSIPLRRNVSARISQAELVDTLRRCHYVGFSKDDSYSCFIFKKFMLKRIRVDTLRKVIDSFDDERQLVRTTVAWNPRTGEENQPDYGAFSYQLHEAVKESENVIEFVCKTSSIICNTLLVTVLVGLSMTLPITMVSMGVKYLDDCPKEPRVPVYLLVGGCFGMIKLLSTLWRNIQARRYQDIELVFDDNDDSDGAFASTTYRTMDTILFLFLVGWQVAGTYWTLEIWKPLFKQKLHEPRNWCDQTVYMFTVYQLMGCYGAMAFYLLVLLLLTFCYRWCNCSRI